MPAKEEGSAGILPAKEEGSAGILPTKEEGSAGILPAKKWAFCVHANVFRGQDARAPLFRECLRWVLAPGGFRPWPVRTAENACAIRHSRFVQVLPRRNTSQPRFFNMSNKTAPRITRPKTTCWV